MTHRFTVSGAFTLIELLVVISIISILMAIIMPTISAVRESANKVDCGNNLRQIGMAQGAYCEDNRGNLPFNADGRGSGQTGQDKSQLEYMLAPYFVGRQDADHFDGWWSGVSQRKNWVCKSSPIIGFAPFRGGTGLYADAVGYKYRGGMVGDVNSYEGAFQYLHWANRDGTWWVENYGNGSEAFPMIGYLKLVSFSNLAAVPFHFCSNRWQASGPFSDDRPWWYGCQGISWHRGLARPTVFLDGHVKTLISPQYTVGADMPNSQTLLVNPWNFKTFAVNE